MFYISSFQILIPTPYLLYISKGVNQVVTSQCKSTTCQSHKLRNDQTTFSHSTAVEAAYSGRVIYHRCETCRLCFQYVCPNPSCITMCPFRVTCDREMRTNGWGFVGEFWTLVTPIINEALITHIAEIVSRESYSRSYVAGQLVMVGNLSVRRLQTSYNIRQDIFLDLTRTESNVCQRILIVFTVLSICLDHHETATHWEKYMIFVTIKWQLFNIVVPSGKYKI